MRAQPAQNSIRHRRSASLGLLTGLIILTLGQASRCTAQEQTEVEVYWRQSRAVAFPDVSHAVVLDESVCQAEVMKDQVRFTGLVRGETLVFVWTKDERQTLLVRVVNEPPKAPRHSLRSEMDGSARAYLGSSLQSNTATDVSATYVFFQRFSYQQDVNGNHLNVQGLSQDATTPAAPRFNLMTASVQYATPHSTFSFLDSVVNLSGGLQGQIVPYYAASTLLLRGGNVSLRRGDNQFEFFGGSTPPPFFLNLAGTRDLAGFNFNHSFSERLFLHATTGVTDVPFLLPQGGFERHRSAFQNLGLTSHLSKHWAVQATGGGSTEGMLLQGAAAYTGESRSGFVTVTRSAANFPLNQLQVLSTGRSSATAGASAQLTSWLAGMILYQHTSTQSGALFTQGGSSDYINPNLTFLISPRNRLTVNYTATRTQGGLKLGGRSTGQRETLAFSTQITEPLGNSAEVSVGSLSDPFQLNSQSSFSIRDSLNLRIKARNTLFLSFSQDRTDPSLESRLNQEIGLLSPDLRALFLLDPIAFVESPNLPPELRAFLSNVQPSNTQVTLGGQLLFHNRLNLSPNVGYFHSAHDPKDKSNSHLLGYTLTFLATPTLRLESSLSNLFLWDTARQGVQRNTVLTFGFNKALNSPPRWLIPPRRVSIRGRVYRDLDVNGHYNSGEPGMPGVRVELNTGQTVLTDTAGRFEFPGLRPDTYDVNLPLLQFKEAVRVTGSTNVHVEFFTQRTAEVNFGIVNFSRVMGNIFNDYLVNGNRQPDAPGIRRIHLLLSGNGAKHDVTSDASGDYEFDELAPGNYEIAMDPSSFPPNFVGPAQPLKVHIGPAETATRDVPLTALRSIAGQVLLKTTEGSAIRQTPRSASERTPNKRADAQGRDIASLSQPGAKEERGRDAGGDDQESKKQSAKEITAPLEGVQLAVGRNVVMTDAQGNFTLRNLPAGESLLEILPYVAVPEGIKLPAWTIQLVRDPIAVDEAKVVISNPEVLKYILPQTPAPPNASTGASRTGNQ